MLIHGKILDMLTDFTDSLRHWPWPAICGVAFATKSVNKKFWIFNIDKCVTSLPDVFQGRRLYITQQLEGENCRLDRQPNISNDKSNQQFWRLSLGPFNSPLWPKWTSPSTWIPPSQEAFNKVIFKWTLSLAMVNDLTWLFPRVGSEYFLSVRLDWSR